jgi:AI2M/AI1M-like, HNH endonuclease
METSMLKTLARKHDSSVSKMARKYKATVDTPYGSRTCFQASIDRSEGRKPLVAQFGGIPLVKQKGAVLTDRDPAPDTRRKELITRLLRGRCEMCRSTDDVRVHHVRKLADLDKLGQPSPPWAQLMAKRRRKALVVCGTCHASIHGTPAAQLTQ